MTTMGIWGPVCSRALRVAILGIAFVVLAAFFFLTSSCRAADALLSDARRDVPADIHSDALSTARTATLAGVPAQHSTGTWTPQSMLHARGTGPSLSLMPYLDYLLDESGSLDIEEAAAPDRADSYVQLVLEKLPRTEGVMWLRFTLAPLEGGERPATLLLDMGESIPGTPVLYEPERNDLSGALEWRESSPAQRNVLLLPEASAEPVTCYIRLDGLPGLWFSPMVRTPADAATNWGSLARTASILSLGVVMLLCLLRGISENGQWRIWTALYVAVALGQALLGMPGVGGHGAGPGQAAVTLMSGIALMLLPHVGRHLMRTSERARGLDIQLLLLSLPGAVLALLPLVPGWAWLDRWLDLWPVATLLFVPTALGAWLMGLGGARRFLLGCLLPPLFVAIGVLGLDFGIPPNLLASAPLWGTALSALLIAATGVPTDMASKMVASEPLSQDAGAHDPDEAGIITLEHPLDDPNLRLVSGMPAASSTASGVPAPDIATDAEDNRILNAVSVERARTEARESALRAPLDDLLREGAALAQCALPPAVRQYAAGMLAAARRMADVLSRADAGEALVTAEDEGNDTDADAATAFDLQRLLREVHGAVAPAAEYAGIGLAWYMPPHLGQLYRGDAQALGEVLSLLLESAVRATSQGAVHLSARRVPESSDAGNILFTVTDSGTGAPPRERSSLALARVWELAARYGGYVGMEYGPNGTTIAFSLHLEPLEDSVEEMPGDTLPHVIIVADDPRQRRDLARMVADLPCRCSEAASEHEALRRHEENPAVLLVAQGRYALPAAADMVTKFMERATGAGLSGCKVLAITMDNSQWNLLADSGFTHALLEPVDAEGLRQTVRDVIRGVRRVGSAALKTPEERPENDADAVGVPPLDSAGSVPQGDVQAVAFASDDISPEVAAGADVTEIPYAGVEMPQTPPAASEEPQSRMTDDGGPAFDAPLEFRETPILKTMDDAQMGGELSDEGGEHWLSGPETSGESEPAPEAETKAPEISVHESVVAGADEARAPGAGDVEADVDEDSDFFTEYAVVATAVVEAAAMDETAPTPDAPVVSEISEAPGREGGLKAGQESGSVPVHTEVSPGGSTLGTSAAAHTSIYVSPTLASPGEWVGEPMPIGTPVPRRETPRGEREWPDASARQHRPAQPARSSYTSPSVPVPGEWVGEPVPIPRKAQATDPKAEGGGVTPAESASPASEEAGSLMDFIVGATRVEASTPSSQEATGQAQASGGVADFVETSVTLVTSAVSSAFSTPTVGDGTREAEQAAPSVIPEEEPSFSMESGADSTAPDTTILALVERLDMAMAQASEAHAAGRGQMVAQAAARIAEESESVGLRLLARMARCVERAGRAGDMNALRDLLPELAVSVERNRITLTQR